MRGDVLNPTDKLATWIHRGLGRYATGIFTIANKRTNKSGSVGGFLGANEPVAQSFTDPRWCCTRYSADALFIPRDILRSVGGSADHRFVGDRVDNKFPSKRFGARRSEYRFFSQHVQVLLPKMGRCWRGLRVEAWAGTKEVCLWVGQN